MVTNESDTSIVESDEVEPSEKKAPGKDDKKILEIARSRWDLAVEAENDLRTLALEDLRFRSGEQWDPKIKASRQQDRRPCLTINRLPQYIRSITNDQRQNRPSIKVDPVDDKADVETAKVYQGLIRHIEYNSNADVAYDTAFESAVTTGLGYYRIVTDYCDPLSFEQEIKIRRVRNRSTVYMDPSYQEPDASDSNWCFIFEDLSHDEYKAQNPGKKLPSLEEWRSIGDTSPDWMTKETVRVAEYFYKEYTEEDVCLLSTGESALLKDLEKMGLPEGVHVVDSRKSIVPQIKWIKMNGIEILDRTDWPGKWIPIVPVLGDELDIDGKRILEGVIRHAKDSMRMYNVMVSAEAEAIGLAPKAPFIGAEGQFAGHEAKWREANIKNFSYLEYKPVTLNGATLGPPQRNAFEPAVMAITQARQMAAEDLKATTGIYDAGLGMKSNETSGKAIQRRAQQSQTNNFHFIDNLTRALRHGGRIIIDLIPHIYDTARAVRIMNEDGSVEMAVVNQVFEKNGETKEHKLGHGKYDVTVSTGPSFATKRQEAVESMIALSQSNPQILQVAGDLMVKNMDWPGADEISKRLKKTLAPGLAEPEEGEQKPVPPEIQAQMQQMNQMIEQLTGQLNEKTDLIKTKTIELESKERIEMAKLQVELEIELARQGSKEALAMLHAEIGQIESRMNLLKQNTPIEVEPEIPQQPEIETEASPEMASQPTGGFPPG